MWLSLTVLEYCLHTRSLAAPVQRTLGLYLPGNDLMLHVAMGTELEGERQMIFDQLDRLRRGDVLILDRGYPASRQVQALVQRGIDFVIRCDSIQGRGAARDFLRSDQRECWRWRWRWRWLLPSNAPQASTWELDGPAQMRARLVRHVSSSGHTRVLATALAVDVTSATELADLYHGRWRIEDVVNRLRHQLRLKSLGGMGQHALLAGVATKVLADNLAVLLNRTAPLAAGAPDGAKRQINLWQRPSCSRAISAPCCWSRAGLLKPFIVG